ncbi:hypothetical protein K437DRAFT_267064 [Tilletiaria anomala UBC 951]|uniref:Uncharacterized protein n=1 Tax=Tilletiaria anomala (strain ATCC 24038 / CBS 436.72 / UBC 951) TaxID=1037660 RepID=A0A066WK56_TILAU|nr:uncharacterized protein K437DRAFT_267064 [Tilletiaria anomala UBC 951]KDN51394.1 hypothetical protein K437DRAFT_267064 [Tilletiaria anomala UBC 951]
MAEQQPQGGAPPQADGQQDLLDKGIEFLENKSGHLQSKDTTEKISDGIRNVFKKVTGKDIPIQDKQ